LPVANISATSSSWESAFGVMRGASDGSDERIMISPRLFGRQLDQPMEKPGQGSGLRIGRSPGRGMTVENAWK
jgi:hypothetical protein